MRLIVLITLNLIALTSYFLWHPQEFFSGINSVANYSNSTIDSIFYAKEVRIKGQQRLNEYEIREKLPVRLSNAYWHYFSGDVVQKLHEHPLVDSASVKGCPEASFFSWSCFEVTVHERTPKFIGILGHEAWLLGEDGSYILNLTAKGTSTKDLKKVSGDIRQTVVIKGLLDKNYSVEVLQAWIERLSKVVEIVEDKARLNISTISLVDAGELQILFREQNFNARFDFQGGDLSRVYEQADRLSKVIADNRSQLTQVAEIDLAFKKIAVVKFIEKVEKKVNTQTR